VDITDTIVGIDIGTTKTCAVVAAIGPDNNVSILGVGLVPTRGMQKGIITDASEVIATVRECKLQAEKASNVNIDSAFVNLNGTHIKGAISNAVVAIADPNRGITIEDAESALDIAQRVEIPAGRRMVDVRIRDYIVDGQIGISDPVGMSGMRLEVNALLVTAKVSQLEDVYRAVNNSGIDVENLIISPIASAEAVLGMDERERGVALIDIGGGTTGIAVYRDDGLAHVSVLPVGGDHVDSDLAYGIGITKKQGQHLKIRFGGIGDACKNSDDIIEITKTGGDRKESLPLKILSEIIEPRYVEILSLARNELEKAGLLKELMSGIVLTGGASLLPGTQDLAAEIFGKRVKIGTPKVIEGLPEDIRNPMFAGAVGLIRLGMIEYLEKGPAYVPNGVQTTLSTATSWGKAVLRWIFI